MVPLKRASIILIREIDLDRDIAVLHELNQVISPNETVEDLRTDLVNLRQGQTFVAEDNGNALGFVSVAYPYWDKVALTFHFAVFPEHRNNGVGTALLTHVIDTVRSKNMRFLSIRTALWNNRALAFYGRLGLKPQSVFADYFGDGNDMVWLHIDLRN